MNFLQVENSNSWIEVIFIWHDFDTRGVIKKATQALIICEVVSQQVLDFTNNLITKDDKQDWKTVDDRSKNEYPKKSNNLLHKYFINAFKKMNFNTKIVPKKFEFSRPISTILQC